MDHKLSIYKKEKHSLDRGLSGAGCICNLNPMTTDSCKITTLQLLVSTVNMMAHREAEPLYPEPSPWGLTVSRLNTTQPSQEPVGLQEDREGKAEPPNRKQS